MLSPEQTKAFARDGFVAGPVVLAADEVDELREELDRVIAEQDRAGVAQPVRVANLDDEDNPVWQVVNIWQASPAYRRHLHRPAIVEDIAQLTGAGELRVWHDQIQYKPARHGGVNHWHQDAPLWPPIEPMTQVTAWVALDDVDESNGCMSMVRGSHLWGDQMERLDAISPGLDLPSTFEGQKVEISLRPVKKGQVHYHHSVTWHSSHGNRSDRPRRAIAVHYMTGETRHVAAGKDHPMRAYITVGDGERLTGDAFPLVYDGKPVLAEASGTT
ncbi:MAG TPA: phytanoyl-CoA dioxygenase family protein [Acidimicrobiales bacterium]|nr:phytanoyl-CoA dioxygenase family protein [Acidimicrobiales bacterium]